jgi:hypothetical protein
MNSSRKLFYNKLIPRIPINKILKKSSSSIGNSFKYKNSTSQSLRETFDTNLSYINEMYKKGKMFEYDNISLIGSHRSNLGNMEDLVRENGKKSNNDKKILNKMNIECYNLNNEFKENIKKLKDEINDNICDLEIRFNNEVNKQKVARNKIKYEMKELKKLMWDNQSLLTQLRTRIKSLKYKIDAGKIFSVNGNLPESYIIY